MEPQELIEKLRAIKGIEQAEYCPIKKEELLIAFIIRANSDNRYGVTLHTELKSGKVSLIESEVKGILVEVEMIVEGYKETKSELMRNIYKRWFPNGNK